MAENDILLPVVGINGFHLKHEGLDHIIVVLTGRTGSWHNVILGFGIVEAESDACIQWFLERVNLEFGSWLNNRNMFILSDCNKSIIKGIAKVLPLAHHFSCRLHLLENVKDYCRKHGAHPLTEQGADHFKAAVMAENLDDFKIAMEALTITDPDAVDYLTKPDPPKRPDLPSSMWSYAHVRLKNREEGTCIRTFKEFTSNLAEHFGSVFKEVRQFDLLRIIYNITEYFSHRFGDFAEEARIRSQDVEGKREIFKEPSSGKWGPILCCCVLL
eukprot:3692657-Rhodomonas_salina.1